VNFAGKKSKSQVHHILRKVQGLTIGTKLRLSATGTVCGQRSAKLPTTDPLNIRPTAARLEVRRQFFSQRVVEDWNGVPEQVKGAVSVIGFKAGLKKHLQGMTGPVQ
jgi:hypothetical protein